MRTNHAQQHDIDDAHHHSPPSPPSIKAGTEAAEMTIFSALDNGSAEATTIDALFGVSNAVCEAGISDYMDSARTRITGDVTCRLGNAPMP